MEGTEDCKKQSNGSHGGTVRAWSNRDSLPILLAIYIQSVYPKSYQEAVHYTSVPPCAIRTSVTLPLPPSSP